LFAIGSINIEKAAD